MSDRERTSHASLQILGLTMMSLAVVALIVVSWLIRSDTESLGFLGFLVVVGVVLIAVTFVVWRFDTTWARILGLIATLAVGAAMWWLAFGVFQIFSPIEFIVGLVMLLGILLALIWGIMALVSGIRGRVGPTKTDGVLRTWVPGLVVVLSVASIAGFFFTRDTVSEAEAAGATPLSMVDFEFDPEDTVTDGKLLIHNADPFAHDLTIDDLDVYVYVGPGSNAIVDLNSAAPGTYDYFCSLHTDTATGEGMTGRLTVEG